MTSYASRPRAISRRKPATFIDPSGKASLAAISNLSGVVGVTVPISLLITAPLGSLAIASAIGEPISARAPDLDRVWVLSVVAVAAAGASKDWHGAAAGEVAPGIVLVYAATVGAAHRLHVAAKFSAGSGRRNPFEPSDLSPSGLELLRQVH